MTPTRWFDKQFDYNSVQNNFPSTIERLRRTPVRLEGLIWSLPADIFTIQLDGSWSIAENIGHLIDLEPLWQGRFDDFLAGVEILRAADLQNTKTNAANHNARSMTELLDTFRSERMQTVVLLESLNDSEIHRTALHPRLKIPMRLMDAFFFTAQHDDHHLGRIADIAQRTSR